MKQEPLVSIIMNCYNGEKYLREAIDSVYAQSHINWEIIFWDNASTDDTKKIATSYDSRLKYFRADVNTPLGSARNLALKKVTGKYIAFLDTDDAYLPWKLQKQVEVMESGNYGLLYGGTIIIDKEGKEIKRSKPAYSSGYIVDQLLRRYDISMCSVMIARSVIENNKLGFNESMGYCPDYNLFMKIAAQHPVGVLHDFIVKYRRSPDSLSRKTFHLVAKEMGQTLDELQALYPEIVTSCNKAMMEARLKLNFYDAVNHINMGDYIAAQSALRPIIWNQWEYLAMYLTLFLPIPREWILRVLKR
ncbi:MAG: glycosyltransferase family 2 protein [Candidatus Vogelbacteria bacterium]|nr:glycosyltransferase family 2 protein [Candidatus Vogelbacteria bacterium]